MSNLKIEIVIPDETHWDFWEQILAKSLLSKE
jgi:hypothetical protein